MEFLSFQKDIVLSRALCKEIAGRRGRPIKWRPMSASEANSAVAEKFGLRPKEVTAVITSLMELEASELKKKCVFRICGCLNLRLKHKTKPVITVYATKLLKMKALGAIP